MKRADPEPTKIGTAEAELWRVATGWVLNVPSVAATLAPPSRQEKAHAAANSVTDALRVRM